MFLSGLNPCVFVAVLVCVGLLRVSTHGGVPPKLNYETLLAIGMGIFMATASPSAYECLSLSR